MPLTPGQVAEAIVDALRQSKLSQPCTPARGYLPQFTVAELENLHLTVIPRGYTIEPITRGAYTQEFRTDVAIQQHVNPADQTTLDALAGLAAEIILALHGRTLNAAGTATKYVGVTNEPFFSEDHLRDQSVWSSVLTFTHRATIG